MLNIFRVKKLLLYCLLIIGGAIIGIFALERYRESSKNQEQVRIINHQVIKLSKLIVFEQHYSMFITKKFSDFNSKILNFLNKNIVLYVTAKAQTSYDMKKLKIKVESSKKIIYIESIPNPELNIYPNVEVFSMESGIFNKFSQSDLNEVINFGKAEIIKKVKQSMLIKDSKNQLIENLNDLYMIAKYLDWKIVDHSLKK